MAGPRFAPRDFAEDARGFGHTPVLRWVQAADPRAEVFLRAAQLQHQQVLRIRERMQARGLSPKQYATQAQTSYPRLLRLLRGEAILRLEDIALADLVLGDVVDAPAVQAPKAPAASDLQALLEAIPERTAQAVLRQMRAAQAQRASNTAGVHQAPRSR
ncbi:helix-turn-helix domain-containing protein [Curtobacterium sp. NPDC098951]|uniref:helix-turn-helix domain-containing protein n=1 Tax=Curtobacterium sp. NPDC098951 TaxID=3363974 RepID=UPI00380BCA0B